MRSLNWLFVSVFAGGILIAGAVLLDLPLLLIPAGALLICALVFPFLYRILRAQSRLSEWLATVGFASLVMAIASFISDAEEGTVIIWAVIAVVWAFAGSMWGWNAATRAQESDAKRRLWMMCAGWMGLVGILSTLTFLSLTLILAIEQRARREPEVWVVYFFSAILILLVWPAIRLERRVRRIQREQRRFQRIEWIPCETRAKSVNDSTLNVLKILLGIPIAAIGPPVVKWTFWLPAKPEFADVQFDDLPEDVARTFQELKTRLLQLGFQRHVCFSLFGQMPHAAYYSCFSVNPAAQDVCVAEAACMHIGGMGAYHRNSLRFHSQLADGTVFETFNDSDPNEVLFSPVPTRRALWYPGLDDPQALYARHRAWTEGLQGKILPAEGTERDYLGVCLRKEIRAQVTTGCLYHDAVDGIFRPTWKGACIVSWNSTIPFSTQRRRLKKEAAKIERQLANKGDS